MIRIMFIDAGDPAKKIRERFHPLWPAYLASYVDKRLGSGEFKFHLTSLNAKKELVSFKPHLVAISSVSSNYSHAMNCARMAKSLGIPVIIGGIHISTLPNTLTEDMDVGCIGEGGETFTELLKHYVNFRELKPERLSDIKGIVYHENGALNITPARPKCKSMDELPHPKRSLIGYHHTDTMMTSRGCPYKCVYCSVTRYWDEMSFASPEYVVEEIRELVDKGTRIIKFYDDLFITNRRRLKTIADKIKENELHRKAKFACWVRSDSITAEVVEILKSMNIVSVEMGIESGCERSLHYLKGGSVSVEDNWRAIDLLKDEGIQTNGTFIIGSPDETEEEIMQTYNFIKKSRLDTVTVNILVPFPGTAVWDLALKRNLVSTNMDWSKIYNVYLSERLDSKDISSLLKKLRKLSLIKRIKALPKSPWLSEAPKIVTSRLAAKAIKLANSLTKNKP